MKLTEQDKKYINAMLTAYYQVSKIRLEQDENTINEIANNTCSEEKWQELYYRFLKGKY